MPSKILDVVKQKPHFKADDFELYLADSIEFMASIPENSVDMIFADPPYNLSNGGFTVHAGKRVSVDKGKWDVSKGFDEDFGFHLKWLEECHRILKPNGTLWVSGTYHSIYQCGYAIQLLGFKILNDIAWFKPNASPNLSGRYFTASHETLIWARKDPKGKHTYNYLDMKKGNWHETDSYKREDKQMRSVWDIATPPPSEKKFGKHPTQKPLALLERILLSSTNEGDVVLDPFTGSSTTGLAAAKFGRKFIGVDLEKDYLNLSKKRYEDLVAQAKLL
ncbi:MAG TPA: site-specific DNA-methyltransferase [Candidatus Saccharimonadales bacterium]|nr:site-specific DNA-methyltransferase [Candidatus Saccharimonadales bacterium]